MTLPSTVPLWPRMCAHPLDGEFDAAEEVELTYSRSNKRRLLRALRGSSDSAPLPQDPHELSRQAADAVRAFAKKASAHPEHIVSRLTSEEEQVMRDLLTAREHTLSFDDAFAQKVASRQAGEVTTILARLVDKGLLIHTHIDVDFYYRWLPYTKAPIVRAWSVQPKEPPAVSTQAVLLPEAMERVLRAISREAIFFRGLVLPKLSERTRAALKALSWECDAQEIARLADVAPNSGRGMRLLLLSPLTSESLRLLKQHTGYSEAHCEFLISLAYTLGLVEARQNDQIAPQRVVVNPAEAERWFSLSPEEQLLSAWQYWVNYNADWFEARQAIAALPFNRSFSIVHDPNAGLAPAGLAYELHGLRAYLARVLRGLPEDKWVYWSELAEQLFAFHPTCAWSVLSPSVWWFASADGQTPIDVTQREGWSRTIGQLLAQMLRGPLLWLGVVEVGSANGNSTLSFRVTSLGRALLEDMPPKTVAALLNSATPPPSGSVTWVNAYTVRLDPSMPWSTLTAQTRLWAELGQEAHTYVFTPGSIVNAIKANRDVEALRAAYTAAGSALSSEVEALLSQIAQRQGHARIYETMAVVQLADEAMTREVLAHSKILQQAYPLSPTAFALSPQAADALIQELRQKGYTPLVES